MSKKFLVREATGLRIATLLIVLTLLCMFAPVAFSAEEETREYVGMSTCLGCHEDTGKRFKLTSHYANVVDSEEGLGGGCESCHGPGSVHADSANKRDIIRNSSEQCFNCHMAKKAQFQLQHHHPVLEGRMSCSDCHNLHGSEIETLSVVALQKSDQACFKCHKELKGPFVFEHDPMRDGCQTCHNPHGTVYDKLLIADQTSLCLRCHWEPSFNNVNGGLGGVPHGVNAGGGGDYFIGRGQECIDHHRAPHGSNIWRTFNR